MRRQRCDVELADAERRLDDGLELERRARRYPGAIVPRQPAQHLDLLGRVVCGVDRHRNGLCRRASIVTARSALRSDPEQMSNDFPSAIRRYFALDALSGWRIAGLGFIFVWFMLGGIAHFALTDIEMRIVPPYVPWPRVAVLASGAFELLGAVGLLGDRTRRAAGIGLFLLTLAVTPCHVYMLQRPELFDVPYWALVLRMPVQLALLALIAWSTAPVRRQNDGARVPGSAP
jgi:uncharacterized membrane protein